MIEAGNHRQVARWLAEYVSFNGFRPNEIEAADALAGWVSAHLSAIDYVKGAREEWDECSPDDRLHYESFERFAEGVIEGALEIAVEEGEMTQAQSDLAWLAALELLR